MDTTALPMVVAAGVAMYVTNAVEIGVFMDVTVVATVGATGLPPLVGHLLWTLRLRGRFTATTTART
jgi:hypothetical protein